MKVVYNSNYGGFRWPKEICDRFGIRSYDDTKENRTNPDIVAALEDLLKSDRDSCYDLQIVDIPDNATDWMFTEYDGLETVYCVIDGKIHIWDLFGDEEE